MQVIAYKGYEIESEAQKLKHRDEWTLKVTIIKHDDGRRETRQRPFSASNTFPTREEANAEAIRLGKKIIDGNVQDMSVDDL